ncbi:GNAT family N-acetyltransferase [Pedococcus bigeumensis]|uniref:GNAT family N-acetyltransferase n=1 Tax=Pedococcus bigeumensis TaxID=433644 RepID=UPI0031E0B214
MVTGVERVLDREGRVLAVRDVTDGDLAAVAKLFEDLSFRSARQRFLCTSKQAGPRYVATLADPARTLDAIVVLMGPRVMGVGSTHPGTDASTEFAVAVEDADQGRGIGTVLVEALVARSRRRGLPTLSGTVLGGNTQMLDVLAHLGLPCRMVVEEGGTIAVTVTISPAGALTSAHLAREETARAAAVRRLLEPAAVAVLDASRGRRPGRDSVLVRAGGVVGSSPITRVDGGYDVTPGVDLAVLPDRADDVGAAALACAAAGVPTIALMGREVGGSRVLRHGPLSLAADLVERLRDEGARVLGPGSTCLVNTDPLVGLHLGGPRSHVMGGVVGVVTDDGQRLPDLVRRLTSHGLGMSAVADVGASADLSVADVLAWLARDPRTEVVVVLLSGDAPAELVRHLGRVHETHKPVVLLAGGVATGDEAGPGPVRAASATDVVDLVSVLVQRSELPGRRAVVVTNEPFRAGAATPRQFARGALMAPDLTQHSEMRIHFLAPGTATRGAVLALPEAATAEQVHDVLETLADDPGVDSVVVDLVPNRALRRDGLEKVLHGLPSESSRGRPVPLIVAVDPGRSRQHHEVPAFATVGEALDVLARTTHPRPHHHHHHQSA